MITSPASLAPRTDNGLYVSYALSLPFPAVSLPFPLVPMQPTLSPPLHGDTAMVGCTRRRSTAARFSCFQDG